MDGAATECAAFDETVVFLSHFKDLRDPRQQGKVSYPLDEILLLCLLAVLAGAECFTEIALFGVFRPFRDGTPAHDHLGGHRQVGRHRDWLKPKWSDICCGCPLLATRFM